MTMPPIYRRALKETASALRLDKPVIAVLGAAVAFGGVWWFTGQPGWGAVATLTASLVLFVPMYIVKLAKLAGAADARAIETERRLHDRRDPDSLYQLGMAVAQGPQALIALSEGVVVFPHVTSEGAFNIQASFEYREYVLEILDGGGGVHFGAGGRMFHNHDRIVTRIIGRRE